MVVVPVRPGRRIAWGLAAAFAGLLLIGSGFLLRDVVAGEDVPVEAVDGETPEWLGGIDLAEIRLATVVDAGANERLRRTIKELRDRIGALEEEARFYRRLVAPSEAERGFRIERLTISSRAREPLHYDYSLLLTQIVDRHSRIEGSVTVEVAGERDGTPRTYTLADLTPEEIFAGEFRFLYFQEFSGLIVVPDGFVPRAVTVTARMSDDDDTRHRQVFDWTVEEG